MPTGSAQPAAIHSPAFEAACAFVIDRLEGTQLISDSGGLTRWGISQRAFPGVDIASLTRAAACEMYHSAYWLAVRADELPRGLDLAVFDAAVNVGPQQAVRLLQRVLRVTEDGIPGPETLGAAGRFLPAAELRALYHEIRLRYYAELVARRPSLTPYAHGWRARVCRVADECGGRASR